MRAGRLNKKINIEALTTVVSSDGGTRQDWQVVSEGIWAAIEPLRGKEWFDAGGTHSEVDHRIRIRHKQGIKSSMRVVHKNRIFDVQYAIDIKSDGRELHLMCKEHGAD